MQVTIDGVPYAPVCNTTSSRIGIAISTHNRAGVLSQALEHQLRHLPPAALVVVIDDGSQPPAVVPDGVQLIRHDKSLGIVASKNASLTALMDAGCEHLFLWDDDAWPVADGWWLPYIDSPSLIWLINSWIWLARASSTISRFCIAMSSISHTQASAA